MKTPDFKGTHLFDRLVWAKSNLEPVQSDYRVVYEDSVDECAKILVPDPHFMAACMNGGIIPKIENYWALREDEAKPDFVKHTRGYLLHETEPMEAMSEKEVIEFLILKDCPPDVINKMNKGNRKTLLICKKEQLPSSREWRNAWRINQDLAA